jgi:outer membrane immunogenic protein
LRIWVVPQHFGVGAVKSSLLASTALCAVFASAASAAGAPIPPPPPGPAPFSWTGFYIGGNVGGLWSHDTVDASGGYDFGSSSITSDTRDPSGVVGGVQAGYNYQFQSFVVGAEGDLDWSGAKSEFSYPGYFDFDSTAAASHSASLPFFADLRGRVGYAFDRFLPYVTGGVVFADVTNKLSDPGGGIVIPVYPISLGRGGATGWTIGGGAEYAIDSHWSVKAEYLYMQFPDVTKTWNSGKGFESFKFKDEAEIARLGLNYRF